MIENLKVLEKNFGGPNSKPYESIYVIIIRVDLNPPKN